MLPSSFLLLRPRPPDQVRRRRRPHRHPERIDPFGRYLDRTGIPPSAAEERSLAEAVAQGCNDAAASLVVRNLRLVTSIATRYTWSGIDLDDLVQQGNMALMHAVTKFDPTKGYRFSTYATYWIKQGMRHYISMTQRPIRYPLAMQEHTRNVGLYAGEFETRYGRPPTNSEIAKALGMEPDYVARLAHCVESVYSLEAPVAGAPSERLSDTLSTGMSVEDQVAQDEVTAELLRLMTSALSERDLTIAKLLYGFNGPALPLPAVASFLGVHSQAIVAAERRIKKILRPILLDRGFAPQAVATGPLAT